MPHQWRNQIWQSLEEGAGKRCSECEFGVVYKNALYAVVVSCGFLRGKSGGQKLVRVETGGEGLRGRVAGVRAPLWTMTSESDVLVAAETAKSLYWKTFFPPRRKNRWCTTV